MNIVTRNPEDIQKEINRLMVEKEALERAAKEAKDAKERAEFIATDSLIHHYNESIQKLENQLNEAKEKYAKASQLVKELNDNYRSLFTNLLFDEKSVISMSFEAKAHFDSSPIEEKIAFYKKAIDERINGYHPINFEFPCNGHHNTEYVRITSQKEENIAKILLLMSKYLSRCKIASLIFKGFWSEYQCNQYNYSAMIESIRSTTYGAAKMYDVFKERVTKWSNSLNEHSSEVSNLIAAL